MIEVNGTRGYGGERDGRFRGRTIEAVARPSGHRDDASGRFADEMNEAEAVYFARLASAPFMAQLNAASSAILAWCGPAPTAPTAPPAV